MKGRVAAGAERPRAGVGARRNGEMKHVMALGALLAMVLTAAPAVAGITVSVTAPSPASKTVPVTVTTNSTKDLKELRVLIDGAVALTCPAPTRTCVD